jgi:ubiquinone/menaquinone biosynthesis C-methylase UbiE
LDESEKRKWATAGVFGRAAATYDSIGPHYFSVLGRRLVELAEVPEGARVLDVGCGRGAVLFPAAERAGASGQVSGVDLAEPMVLATGSEIQRRGIRNADVRVMDAEQLQFGDNSFDLVLCAFALFFLPHAGQALSEFRRVLKPGGWVALSTWGDGDTRWSWCIALLKSYLPPEPRQTKAEIGFDKPEHMQQHLRAAGFRDVRVIEETSEFTYSGADEWWQSQWSHGGRGALESLSADGLARFQHDVYERLDALRTPRDLPVRMSALFSLAVK